MHGLIELEIPRIEDSNRKKAQKRCTKEMRRRKKEKEEEEEEGSRVEQFRVRLTPAKHPRHPDQSYARAHSRTHILVTFVSVKRPCKVVSRACIYTCSLYVFSRALHGVARD